MSRIGERRLPPYSEEAERGVLGSMIIDSARVLKLSSEKGLTEDSFYVPANRLLFELVIKMYQNAEVIDLLTVGESLKTIGRLDQCGGYAFLEGLIDSTPTAAHAGYYMEIVKEKEKLRKIIANSSEAIDSCYSDSTSSEIISDLTVGVVSLIEVKETIVSTDSIVQTVTDAKNGRQNTIPTPWVGINRKTGGPSRGMETIFTGRSKSGKSMLKSYWQKYLGAQGIPSLDCCFEDRTLIAKMRCASVSKFSASDMLRGGRYVSRNGVFEWMPTNDRDIQLVRDSLAEMDEMPMYWFDKSCPPKDLKSKLAEYVDRYGIRMAFIDGAKDLIRPSGKYNDTGFDEESSKAVTEAADALNIAIVSIHHLTKLEEDMLIQSSNIRGSGNIVSNARLVYALQGDKHGAGLTKYREPMPLAFDEDGYCTTRVFECIDNNHGGLAMTWLDTDLSRCDFWQKNLFQNKDKVTEKTDCLL